MQQNKSGWVKLIDHLKKNTLLPVVIFVFSKKKCEELAQFISTADLTTREEKNQIRVFTQQAFGRLSGSLLFLCFWELV